LLLALFFVSCTDAPAVETAPTTTDFDPAADKAAAQQLVQDIFDNVWSGTDTSYVRRYQTEDFVILEHGEVWTNDTIRNWQLGQAADRPADAPARRNSFDFFRTEQNGDEIWMAYHNTAHWVNADRDTVGTMGWLESAVAVRTDEGWKLRMMHSTRMPR
jgi:hypothetical protein